MSGLAPQDGQAGVADAERPTGETVVDGAAAEGAGTDGAVQHAGADAGTDPVAERGVASGGAEHEDVRIVPYRDGPLIVRGPITITDQEGNVIDAGRSPVALCRCGRSRIRPFCDGTHTTTKFRAPSGRESR